MHEKITHIPVSWFLAAIGVTGTLLGWFTKAVGVGRQTQKVLSAIEHGQKSVAALDEKLEQNNTEMKRSLQKVHERLNTFERSLGRLEGKTE